MQQHWIRQQGNDRLVIFALGWACDHRVVEHIALHGCDVLCLYDYRTIEPLMEADFATYSERYLFAWSFGVWAAEQVLANVRFTRAIALNGTPFPVDNQYGIEPRRLMITIRGLLKNGVEEFNRRTYGPAYEQMKNYLSPRSADANIEELTILADAASLPYTPHIEWNKAIIGADDVIFPVKNMINYWGIRSEVLPLPHYPMFRAELIESEIDNR